MLEPNVIIRRLVPDDASGLSQCFERCYGRSYVVRDFYDPAAIERRIANGTLRSVLAVTESGEIVGHMGLTIRDPGARTVDAGNSIVDPRYRGRQVAVGLAAGVVELCREGGFLGFHHYPTTAHPIMQTMAVEGGGIETGIMLDYIPPGTEYREIEGEPRRGRLAVVVVYQPVTATPPREVFVPGSLEEAITGVYALGRLPRTVRATSTALPSRPTRLEARFDLPRGLLRIDVAEIGSDLCDRVRAAGEGVDAAVAQLDLRMNDASIAAAVDAVGELGFYFSAVLPEYLDGDILRLQRPTAGESARPELVTEQARSLLRTIEADRLARSTHEPRRRA